MNYVIRSYHSHDYKGLIVLLNEVYESNVEQQVLEKHYLTDDNTILVATNEVNEVIGCTFIEIQEDFVRPRRIAYVTYVAVADKYRHKGIGKKILSTVEEFCYKHNCSAIELTSANYRIGAHAFYESIGYTKKKTTLFIKEV